jgi:phosphoenolpyruvate synthase/pyruvate phosphate dikinase
MTTFSFSTKAQNLLQLEQLVQRSIILPVFRFTIEEWFIKKVQLVELILKKFSEKTRIVVRSSALDEDSVESSMAGKFKTVLDVAVNGEDLTTAINDVIGSYSAAGLELEFQEILIQPMLSDVSCSGVIFTRMLETGSPYYVINYDDVTTSTDTVTSGASDFTKNVLIHRGFDAKSEWSSVIAAVKELELVCSSDALDIEFAITSKGKVVIFQVRPLVYNIIKHQARSDQIIKRQLSEIKKFVGFRLARKPESFGERTILGQMPDWNPAEIIGVKPKPLAYSLYRLLIMDLAWREGRKKLGYQTPEPSSLMVQIAGRPYVDVRASFNSLLPRGISVSLSEKLINYYLTRLEKNPHYHDKVEFYIVHSCLDFNFKKTEQMLLGHSFTAQEVDELFVHLKNLTVGIVTSENEVLRHAEQQIKVLDERRKQWTEEINDPLYYLQAIRQLLLDCIQYGTIPFSATARCAFISTRILHSLAEIGVITEQEIQGFLNSIETVASQYTSDLESYSIGERTLDYLCQEYGHLRPGTYDVTAPRYDDKPEIYFSVRQREQLAIEEATFKFSQSQLQRIRHLLNDLNLNCNELELLHFITESISMREKVKFEFTKNVSLALKYISKFGEYYGLSAQDVAYIPIEYFFKWEQESPTEHFASQCRYLIDEERSNYATQSQIPLPDLIVKKEDIEHIRMIRSLPNFTTNSRVIAESVVLLNQVDEVTSQLLEGKIILIEQADPGYDWLFSRNIGGLITKFGGVASHMAIRCAEFGVPAAIGCGEWLFSQLMQSQYIDLNCQEKKVIPCEGFA